MVKTVLFLGAALAALVAAAPTDQLGPEACPELSIVARLSKCKISNLADCEICCPVDKTPVEGYHCHRGHDVPDPCLPGKQYHCDKH